ncbi:hypothetical protein HPP92_001151 [Vanilla planifolia]|uniref:Pentatricopeptide repeat-containing protein n=1 Tax=Vanilla planifolia TaxID=51239 RepID=A0A835RQ58_VANPL|nr:hypothetical protein HPP92_001151 [Vanilla planifolia]
MALLTRKRLRPFSLPIYFVTPGDFFHGISTSLSADPLQSFSQNLPFATARSGGGALPSRASLSMSCSYFPSFRHRLHCAVREAPPLLPPSYFTSSIPRPLPLLNNRFFASSSESSSDSDDPSLQPMELPSFSNDVDRVCKVINELFASDRNMEAVLNEVDIKLEPSLVLAVLERFCHAHRPAYRFFKWAATRPGFSHDCTTWNKMLGVLGKTRQFETMVSLLQEMGKDGYLSMESFKISIKAFAAARKMKKCMGIFKLMKLYDFQAGLETFNCLIDALAKAKLGKEAQELFDRMKGQFHPDLRTYTVLLYGFCKIKNLAEAGRVWNDMLDSGFIPDVVAHNAMLEGLIRGHRRPEGIKLFELMKTKGPKPNARTFTILIQDLCKSGKMDEAVSCFDEMLTDGCPPDVSTYTCLIVGFGNARRMDKVSSLLTEMKQRVAHGWSHL